MTFSDYLKKSWQDHAKDSTLVAETFAHAHTLMESPAQIAELAQLITHVMGEHLGQWDKGVDILENLGQHALNEPGGESERALRRSIATLRLASGNEQAAAGFSPSDQARIMASAAAGIVSTDIDRASQLLKHADEAAKSLQKTDPAMRALAVASNNIACALEETLQLTDAQKQTMQFAAQASRHYWEIAGTWLQVTRAEYRLTMTSLKAGETAHAFKHAHNCLEIAGANGAEPVEFFYGYEALALAEKARANGPAFVLAVEQMAHYYDRLNKQDQEWTLPILRKLQGTPT